MSKNIFKKSKIFTGGGGASATSTTTGNLIHAATAKTTPVDADEVPIADSAASFILKKVTWANIKATLKTYFDTLYQPLAAALTSWASVTRASGFDTFVTTPSSANLKTLVTDETGSGALVFANTPTLVTPDIGAATGASLVLSSSLNEAKGASIASASTTDIGAATGNYVHITGTTTITALGTVQAGTRRIVVFDSILTLTHNATSLILPTGANITTAAGDCAIFVSEGSGNWKCVYYSAIQNEFTDYSPTYTGFSATPSGGVNRYCLQGKLCTVYVAPTSNGTSNASTFTITLPFNAKNLAVVSLAFCTDNGSITVGGYGLTAAASNVLTLTKQAGTAWTASGSKRAVFTIQYEIA